MKTPNHPSRIIQLIVFLVGLCASSMASAQTTIAVTKDPDPAAAPAAIANSCPEDLKNCQDDGARKGKDLDNCLAIPGCNPTGIATSAPPKAVAPQPSIKPLCGPGTVYDKATNGCVCTDTELNWPGDDGGVSVRIQRKLMKGQRNGVPMYACVATEEGATALYNAVLKRIQEDCDVKRTVDLLGEPNPARNDLYSNEECGKLRAYLHEDTEYIRALKAAKMLDGTPAPLVADTWITVWTNVQDLRRRVAALESDMAVVKATYCHFDEKTGEFVGCPNGFGPFHGGLILQLPVEGRAWIRPGGTQHTYTLTVDPTLIGMFDATEGLYIKGYVGYGHSKRSDRVPTGGGLGWYHGFTPKRVVALRLGMLVGAEPAVRANDAFNAGVDGGLQIRPGNGNFLIDIGLVVGATKVHVAPEDSLMGIGHSSNVSLLVAPGIGLGFAFSS